MVYYNFVHTIFNEAPVTKEVILWNLLDFGHVNFVHKTSYKYCKLIARSGNVSLVEFGANQLLTNKIPLVVKHLMWHQFVPPNRVVHVSKSGFSHYSKVVMEVEQLERDGKPLSILKHSFYFRLPWFALPFKWVLIKYLERWNAILWAEDYEMCVRRQEVLDSGFKDSPMDVLPRGEEGLFE